MNNCTEYIELMHRQLDGELSELETRRLEKHLQQCPACAEDYQSFQEMNDLFQGVEMIEPPLELKHMIMTEIMAEEMSWEIEKEPEVTISITETAEKVWQSSEVVKPHMQESFEEEVATNRSPHFGAILAMVVVACLNGFLFITRLIPFVGVRFNPTERQMVTRLFLQFFARFAVVGRHTGEALHVAFRAVVHYLPWQMALLYLGVAGLSIFGFIYFLRQDRKGGDWT